MKALQISTFFFSLIFASLLISSCGNSTEGKDKSGKEYTSAFICPMHCDGSGSETAGKCPVCKMDYVVNEKAVKSTDPEIEKAHEHLHDDGHGHDHNHDHDHGHDHGHEGHNH